MTKHWFGFTSVGLTLAVVGALTACGSEDAPGGPASSGGGGSTDAGGGASAAGGAAGSGATGSGATGTGATGTGATGGTPNVDCSTAADCTASLPASTPAGCAEATCDTVLGKCVFVAKDADGDGHAAADCVPAGGGVIEVGDDCDDGDQDIFPGSGTEKCNGKDDDCDGDVDEADKDGPPPASTDPCTVGLGECAANGVKICKDGSYSACSATPGTPSPDSPICDGKDHDCDGTPGTGCTCNAGETLTCYQSDPNACNKVQVSCTNGKFPDCPPKVLKQEYCLDSDNDGACSSQCQMACNSPGTGWKLSCTKNDCDDTDPLETPGNNRNCTTAKDNDCLNGPDNQESGCKCGGVAIGGKTNCKNQTGACAGSKQTCMAINSNKDAAWSACSFEPKSFDDCSLNDLNCDGIRANNATCWQKVAVCANSTSCGPFGPSDMLLRNEVCLNGWTQKDTLYLLNSSKTGTAPVYRCYNSTTGKHTIETSGCASGWKLEATWYAPTTSGSGYERLQKSHTDAAPSSIFVVGQSSPLCVAASSWQIACAVSCSPTSAARYIPTFLP